MVTKQKLLLFGWDVITQLTFTRCNFITISFSFYRILSIKIKSPWKKGKRQLEQFFTEKDKTGTEHLN